ncbi:MAG: hypothetical protein HOP14_12765 [Acidobacteria bacterium]|nr:hypothetical protein [Acidobacteriota bacterium]
MDNAEPLQPLAPTYTADLLAPLHDELVQLLRGLPPEAWDRPTVAGAWRVRDVVAHLLDGQLRTLSALRDGHLPAPDATVGLDPDTAWKSLYHVLEPAEARSRARIEGEARLVAPFFEARSVMVRGAAPAEGGKTC